MRKAPSLVDLCVQLAIDNVKYLGDVGETDIHLLDRILSHCSLDQLTHIENRTKGRDLSPVTNKLWKKFYKVEFGVECTNILIERMRRNKVTYKWRKLYKAKIAEREEATKRSLDRIKQRYDEENARKKNRQVQLCTKVPSASKKRSWGGYGGVVANNIYNTKSNLMKKAKLEFVNSREVKNLAAINNKVVHNNRSVSSVRKPVHSVSSMRKPDAASGSAVASSSLFIDSFSSMRKPVHSDSSMRKPVHSVSSMKKPVAASGLAVASSSLFVDSVSSMRKLVHSVSSVRKPVAASGLGVASSSSFSSSSSKMIKHPQRRFSRFSRC